MKDRGIKAAAASDPTYCLENVKQYVFLTDISIILSQTPLPQKCTVAAFTTHALLFLSQPFFSSCRIQTLSLFQSLHLLCYPSPIAIHTSHPRPSSHLYISDRSTKPIEPADTSKKKKKKRSRKAETIAPMNQSDSGVSRCFKSHGQASLFIGVAGTTSFPLHDLQQTPAHGHHIPDSSRSTVFQTHSLHIQSNQHSHSVAIMPCCAVGATTKDPYCVCISQQRPPRKCMHYVFERGRVQKQLPGSILSPSQPSPPGGECKVHKGGR